jgi:hypothetical protein
MLRVCVFFSKFSIQKKTGTQALHGVQVHTQARGCLRQFISIQDSPVLSSLSSIGWPLAVHACHSIDFNSIEHST